MPDVVIVHEANPDVALFDLIGLLLATAPRPVILFTSDTDADKMGRAVDCGIPVYVVNGYSAQRLRPLIHLAQARYARERRQHDELADLESRFEERKLVDRAKGILMRRTGSSEQEAYRILQRTSQDRSVPMVEIARAVLASEPGAEK